MACEHRASSAAGWFAGVSEATPEDGGNRARVHANTNPSHRHSGGAHVRAAKIRFTPWGLEMGASLENAHQHVFSP